MNRLEEELNRLSSEQVERVRTAWASFTEGLLVVEEFLQIVSAMILTGNATGYALGATVARSVIEAEVGDVELTPVRQDLHHLDEDRIVTALETILDAEEQDTEMQLERLADNEPKQAATDGSQDVIRSSDRVVGWVRDINADACELCFWLRKEHLRPGGYIYPPEKPMHKHVGCTCEQTPVATR